MKTKEIVRRVAEDLLLLIEASDRKPKERDKHEYENKETVSGVFEQPAEVPTEESKERAPEVPSNVLSVSNDVELTLKEQQRRIQELQDMLYKAHTKEHDAMSTFNFQPIGVPK